MAEARAWVTGAAGFIGTHLAARLTSQGIGVTGFGRAGGALRPLTADGLAAAFATGGRPDRVYHIAGGSTVGRSLADPLGDFDSNVTTTAILLDFLRRHCPEVPVVLSSSAAVYGSGHSGSIAVDADLAPFSPYGHHKLMAEQLSQAYAENYGLRVTVLRLFSIYGPGICKQLVYDICVRLAADPTRLTLGGTGAELRDWCHVTDAVACMAQVADAAPGEVQRFNLATGVGTSVAGVAQNLATAWGQPCDIAFQGGARPGDPFSLVANPTSLPPGFAPAIGLVEGLADFVGWFKARAGGQT